jgi:hypothetical protein
MQPIKFKEQNCTYAENQPDYIPLPAHKDKEGVVTTCWKFSIIERFKILFGSKLYWQQLTFNRPLQPVKPSVGSTHGRMIYDNKRYMPKL